MIVMIGRIHFRLSVVCVKERENENEMLDTRIENLRYVSISLFAMI